jgi:hypothetical protein
MKSYNLGLLSSVGNTYDKTRTTIAGRVSSKSLNGQAVLGPPLTQFIDTQTLAGIVPTATYLNPNTNRLFVLGAPASGTVTVALFNYDNILGTYSYVGKISVSLANAASTTQTIKGFKVNDSGATWQIVISTTGSVVINGGTYVAWGVVAEDFTAGGTAIYPSSLTGAKAVYFLQDSSALGLNHVATVSDGVALPWTSSDVSINSKVYQQNGASSSLSYYAWDLASNPAPSGAITNGVNAQTTAYAGTSPVAYFTMGASNNGYSSTTPTSALFEAVVLMAGTGAVPTNFNAWANGTAQAAASNVYFIRDLQQVGGQWYFNLAATATGAAIVPTSSNSSFSMLRAFGISGNTFSFKTGIIAPTLTGTILSANSFDYCVPTSAPLNSSLNGQDCFCLGTSTNLYMGKISELTSGVTGWPSLTAATLTGAGADIVAPTATYIAYSSVLDRFIYVTNTSSFVVKPLQNSAISLTFGGLGNAYLEGASIQSVPASLASVTNIDTRDGWLFISGSTVGQRGVIAMDLRSDAYFGYSYIISKVMSTPSIGSVLRFIQTAEQLFNVTDSVQFQIRSAATDIDPIFNTTSGGWTTVQTAFDNNLSIQQYYQIRINPYVATHFANSPAQINEINVALQLLTELSDNWSGDHDNTTTGTDNPSYVAFDLSAAYATSVPRLYVRGYDASGSLMFSGDTVTNASLFSYSTDGGTTWLPLGTIPNTVGTRVRFNVVSPPGVLTFVTIRES